MSHQLGTLLAVGNTSTIHGWGTSQVVKIMLPDTPSMWADQEADWTARVHAAGFPVPEVIDVIDVDGRRAIVFERVVGATMLAQVLAQPASIPDHARRLAELQAWFHSVPAVPGLPNLRLRMAAKIQDAALPPKARKAALARLTALPDGEQLCHGDLHPANVIFADGRLMVVDWFDVAAGDPIADVVRTSLLIRPPRREGAHRHLPGAPNGILATFHGRYLDAYSDITGERLDVLADWELPVAAARLSENVIRDDLMTIVSRATQSVDDEAGGVIHA